MTDPSDTPPPSPDAVPLDWMPDDGYVDIPGDDPALIPPDVGDAASREQDAKAVAQGA